MAKLDSAGAFLWAVGFGGSSVSDYGYDIAAQADGSTLVTGSFIGTASFGAATNLTASGSNSDGFVAKLDSAGAFLWAVGFGGGSAGVYGNAIAAQADGSTVVTGYFGGTASFGGSGGFARSSFSPPSSTVPVPAQRSLACAGPREGQQPGEPGDGTARTGLGPRQCISSAPRPSWTSSCCAKFFNSTAL